MSRMLENAIKETIKYINAEDMPAKDIKDLLREYADSNEGFENMIFEIGLNKVVKRAKKYL